MYETRQERQKLYQSDAWRRIRKEVLETHPLCERCLIEGLLVKATVVDHKIDIIDDESKALDIENLSAMCVNCHNRKSMKRTQFLIKEKKNPQKYNVNKLWK